MPSNPTILKLFLIISITLTITQCLHMQINNIHTGYKTIIQGQSLVLKDLNKDTEIYMLDTVWSMDQLEPELMPFFKKFEGNVGVLQDIKNAVLVDIKDLLIQGIYEQQQESIVLVYRQHPSIVVTFTFRKNQRFPEDMLSLVSQVIKNNCQLADDVL